MWWLTKCLLLLVVIFAGLIAGLVASHYDMALSRYIVIGSLGVVIGVIAIYYTTLAAAAVYREFRWWDFARYRSWGHYVGFTGVVVLAMGVRDDLESSLALMLVQAAVGFGLIGLGWLINHWPSGSQRYATHLSPRWRPPQQ